jgi:hypothetical protein
MLFSHLTLFGLLGHAVLSSAGHSRYHRLDARSHSHLHKRAAPSTQQLQTEMTAFSTWMSTFLASPNASNSPASIAKVQEEVHAHQTAVKAFISGASTSGLAANTVSQLQSMQDAFDGWMSAWATGASSTNSVSALAALKQDFNAYQGWISSWLGSVGATNPAPAPASAPAPVSPKPLANPITTTKTTTTFVTSKSTRLSKTTITVQPVQATNLGTAQQSQGVFHESTPAAAASPAHTAATLSPVAPTPTPTVSPPTISEPPSAPPTSGGSFNPSAKTNVVAYFGQSDATSAHPLSELCASSSIDVVVVAFVNNYFSSGGLPGVNFGAASGNGPSPAQIAAGASGLLDASALGKDIAACQAAGKKVLLSLGGAIGSTTFASDAQATAFAATLWNLFGGGHALDALRPFGKGVVVDGFDIDNESHNPTGYTALVTSLRALMATDTSRQFFISAAPQCPRPDASIPLDAMRQMDFVWVQVSFVLPSLRYLFFLAHINAVL